MRGSPLIIFLFIIATFGFFFRLKDYDRIPPFGATQDEFMYPWAGLTLLLNGVPRSWSWFPSYSNREIVTYWTATYPLVNPWVEKPPLYSLVVGTVVRLFGARALDEVRLSVIRLVPITLSFFTIIFVGLLAKTIFGSQVGLISAVLYAIVPTIVVSNRLSLAENFLTTIILLTIYLFFLDDKGHRWLRFRPYILGILLGFVVLTKNIGIALPIVVLGTLLIQRKWFESFILAAITFVFSLVHPLMGLYYDWNLFISVLKDYREVHALVGLPELVQTLFRFPVIGHKDRLFLDGSMLTGFVLLFSAPFWLKTKDFIKQNHGVILFLGFPFVYITLLALLESGGTDFSFFGWHVYPLFPFLMILLAKAFFDLWQNPDIFRSLFFYLVIGFSTTRFLLLLTPEIQKSWQWILGVLLMILIGSFTLKTHHQRRIFIIFFFIFLIVNILIIFNLNQIYPELPQPLN